MVRSIHHVDYNNSVGEGSNIPSTETRVGVFEQTMERIERSLQLLLEAQQVNQNRPLQIPPDPGQEDLARAPALQANRELTVFELPCFQGSEVKDWVSKANNYFQIMKIPDRHMVAVASRYLIGDALKWYEWNVCDIETWTDLVEGMTKRFSLRKTDNPRPDLGSLKHVTDIESHVYRFNARHDRDVCDSYGRSCYASPTLRTRPTPEKPTTTAFDIDGSSNISNPFTPNTQAFSATTKSALSNTSTSCDSKQIFATKDRDVLEERVDTLEVRITKKGITKDESTRFGSSLFKKNDGQLSDHVSKASSTEDFSGEIDQSLVLRHPGLDSKRAGLIELGQPASNILAFHNMDEAVTTSIKSAQTSNVAGLLVSTGSSVHDQFYSQGGEVANMSNSLVFDPGIEHQILPQMDEQTRKDRLVVEVCKHCGGKFFRVHICQSKRFLLIVAGDEEQEAPNHGSKEENQQADSISNRASGSNRNNKHDTDFSFLKSDLDPGDMLKGSGLTKAPSTTGPVECGNLVDYGNKLLVFDPGIRHQPLPRLFDSTPVQLEVIFLQVQSRVLLVHLIFLTSLAALARQKLPPRSGLTICKLLTFCLIPCGQGSSTKGYCHMPTTRHPRNKCKTGRSNLQSSFKASKLQAPGFPSSGRVYSSWFTPAVVVRVWLKPIVS